MNNGNLYTYCCESIIECTRFHTTNRKRAFSAIEKECELTPGLNLKLIQCNQASKATMNKTVIMYMLSTLLSLNPT